MLQRTRSASLPRDLGEGYFLCEADFHSDVYDDTKEEEQVEQPQQVEQEEELVNQKSEGEGRGERIKSKKNLQVHFGSEPPEEEEPNPIERRISFSPIPPLLSAKSSSSSSSSSYDIVVKAIVMIIAGALSSILYEMMLQIDKNSSLLAAFILHLWIVLFSIPNMYQHLFHPKIPIYYHLLIVTLSFTFLFLKSFAIKILPMPIIIVCSNMQLVLGLFVGKFLFNKTFSFNQYLSVFVITFGCTLITITSQDSFTSSLTLYEVLKGVFYILTAILSLTIMIPVGSLIVQKYNANIEEQIFYQHFLSFPLFILQWNRIQPSINQLIPFQSSSLSSSSSSSSDSSLLLLTNENSNTIQFYNISIPIILLLLISTTIFAQFNRYLTMEISLSLSPLLSQLLNTINKTIVLLVSMIYFNSPPYPTIIVWIGVVIQTIGSFVYVQSSISPPSPVNSDTNSTSNSNSKSQSSKTSFQINPRKSRFSRFSITGKRLGISEIDLIRLKKIAEEKEKMEKNNQKNNNNNNSNSRSETLQNNDKNVFLQNNDFKDIGIKRRVAYSSLPDYKR